MKDTLLITFLLIFALNLNGQKKLVADTEKCKLQWRGERVFSEHNGTINLKSGWLTFADNRIKGGEFVIDMNTIEDSEDVQKLENHLRSDDFFSVDKYPESKLVISESTPFEKGNALVNGMLTIRDKTHPIEFNAVMQEKDDGLWFFSCFPKKTPILECSINCV